MELISRYYMVSEQCKTNSFYECLVENGEHNYFDHLSMLTGECAKTYGCLPECEEGLYGSDRCDASANEEVFENNAN